MSPKAKTATIPGLSRARVCQEALALVDAEGPEALSMRRLGARLGVEAMSLYHHVRDKADLIDALHAATATRRGAPFSVACVARCARPCCATRRWCRCSCPRRCARPRPGPPSTT